MTLMFLNGGAMRGGPLNHLLLGAPLLGEVRTAARYRFYSVGDRYPALQEVSSGGVEVAGEVYDVPMEVLRDSLLPAEPPELELGVIELADGRPSLAMVLRREFGAQTELTDISAIGGWRAYRGQG
ncbi:gamma-glutamylcyclotransferase [Rhizocola hellebori]|uniref:Gamma-glutamylcyclotransferase n=1 Tax=Rhizocola hellebori TaxID=1392758 RepID=A0A8J3VGI0_9ACTN|nr:gamma-glutamylcyclotransferase [Rhizocola hellebori]GIH05440.1 gamma-glutamylcyclotransferase [Rhizocola hellebori]